MNIVRDLLPWEPIFSLGVAGGVVTALSMVVSALRHRRVGTISKLLLGIFVVCAVLPWLVVRNFGERLATTSTTNHADTATGTPSDLQPRHYAHPPQQVGDTVAAAAAQLGWTVVSRTGDTFTIAIPVARLGWFTDDMQVTLSETNGTTTVNARSHSRIGRGDLGENWRHIVQLFTVLDQKLKG